MHKSRLLLAVATVAVTLTGGLAAVSRNDTAHADIGGITWSDEFNGSAGSSIDGSKWKFDTGGSGFGNNELEYYTTSTSNVSQDGQATWRSPRAGRTRPTTSATTARASTRPAGS